LLEIRGNLNTRCMTTLIGFDRLRPGTTWRLPPLPTEQCAEEDAVHRKVPPQWTFASVLVGHIVYTGHLGNPKAFIKLQKEYWINESRRGAFRCANAILCQMGEPVFIDEHVAILRANPPQRTQVRKLRKTFFVDLGSGQIVPVNVVHEDADVSVNPHSKSGSLDFFEDPAAPAR